MNRESKDEAPIEPPPSEKLRLPLVVILSISVGILVTLMSFGAIYHYQTIGALKAELVASKEAGRQKADQLAGLHEQIDGLSRQIRALRDFSVARAGAVAAEIAETGTLPKRPAPPPAVTAALPPGKTKPATAAADSTAVSPSGDCRMSGGTAAEKVAALQRCVQEMDGRPAQRP